MIAQFGLWLVHLVMGHSYGRYFLARVTDYDEDGEFSCHRIVRICPCGVLDYREKAR